MPDNICKFITTKKSDDNINIINFVYEKEVASKSEFTLYSTSSIALVVRGNGLLHTPGENFNLRKGSLFFTFASKPYYIENCGELEYIYISFLGERVLSLEKRLHISYTSPVFYDFDFLIDLWKRTLEVSGESNTDLFCEGLLLYTIAFLCEKNEENINTYKKNGILLAKEYIDSNYTDPTLTLQSVSEKFSYNPKYFSSAFKALTRVNFSDYLKEKRLSYSLSLIESGVSNVKEIAESCGYSDPFYFSKTFKAKFLISPKKYIQEK